MFMETDAVKTNNTVTIGILLFFLGASGVLFDYFIYADKYFYMVMLVSVATLFAAIKILSQKNIPMLKLLAGSALTIALFSQAYFIKSHFSLALGLVMFIASVAEYKKDMEKSRKSGTSMP